MFMTVLLVVSIIPTNVSAVRTASHQETPTSLIIGQNVMLHYTISDQPGDGDISGTVTPKIVVGSQYINLSAKSFEFDFSGFETENLFWNYTATWIGNNTVYYNNSYSSSYNQTGYFNVSPVPVVYASATIYPATTDVSTPVYLNYTVVGNGISNQMVNITPYVQRPDGSVYNMLTKYINVPNTNSSSITKTWTTYQTSGGTYEVFFDDTSMFNLDVTPSPSSFYINFPSVPVENEKPVSIIEVSSVYSTVGDDVYFYGHGFDGDGFIVNYTWQIDGGFYYTQNVTYSFSNDQNYLVILTVEDNDGGTDFDTETIYVTEEPVETNEQPLAILGVSTTYAVIGDDVYFYGYGFDSDGYIIQYTWYIDGNEYHTQNVTYSFSTLQNYLVVFTVEDDLGGIDVDSTTICVSGYNTANIPPSAIIDVSTTNALVGDDVIFNGFGFDEDGYVVDFTWNVDGHEYNTQNITYSFDDERTYIVILTVTDDMGGKGITTVSINVTIVPVIEEQVSTITYIYVPVFFVVLAIIFAWNFFDAKTKGYVFTNNFLQNHGDTISVIMLIIAIIDFTTHIFTDFILWIISML